MATGPAIKISLVGSGMTGKSTIRSMLERTDAPTKRTIGVDIGKFQEEDMKCVMFDMGGQERFKLLWDDFLKGSSLVMVVTDSTREDVEKARNVVDDLQTKMKGAKIIAIANKQDQANRLGAMQIEKILKVKTYPMVATEATRRSAMVNILRENLA